MATDFDFSDDRDDSPAHSGPPKVSRIFYILLALFLGGIGIHNFYAGRTVRGLCQVGILVASVPMMFILIGFVTIFIPYCWAVLDAVTVTTDGRGRYMA